MGSAEDSADGASPATTVRRDSSPRAGASSWVPIGVVGVAVAAAGVSALPSLPPGRAIAFIAAPVLTLVGISTERYRSAVLNDGFASIVAGVTFLVAGFVMALCFVVVLGLSTLGCSASDCPSASATAEVAAEVGLVCFSVTLLSAVAVGWSAGGRASRQRRTRR